MRLAFSQQLFRILSLHLCSNVATLGLMHPFAVATPLRPPELQSDVPQTLLLRARLQPNDVDRVIGVADQQTLEELHHVLAVCFGMKGEYPSTFWRRLPDQDCLVPLDASSQRQREQLLPATCIHEVASLMDAVEFHWGLWQVEFELLDVYPRDAATPAAVCIAGEGEGLDGTLLSTSRINVELAGGLVDEVLGRVHAEVRDLIRAGELWDFIPLLQALDLPDPCAQAAEGGHLSPAMDPELAHLPVETSQLGRVAWWSLLLGLVCMNEHSDLVALNVMEEATGCSGWTWPQLLGACAASVSELEHLGGIGNRVLSPVERIALFKELLRAR